MSTAREFYLPFIKKEKVAKDTYSFYFDLAERRSFSFLPGQYIRMILDIENPDNRGNSRFFTIASSPLEKKYIMITTKVIKSSFKKTLAGLRTGERVKFFGPMGGFVLDEGRKDSRVFLAGGIGITPFHSMITYAYTKNLSIPITLLVSFPSIEDLVFYKELTDITKKNPYTKIIYTITRPDERWEGEKGRISEVLIKKYVPNILEPQYFIVGPPTMVASMETTVNKMGVASERVFIENFTGY